MASHKTNPAPGDLATGLGVNRWLAQDTDNMAPLLADVQTKFVAKRTRLRPNLARLVAELIYGRAA